MTGKIRFRGLIVFVLLLFGIGAAYSQMDRATVTGTVADTTGAILPGVTVVITNTDTGTSFSANTNDVGIYTIQALPVGNYTLKVSSSGFKDYTHTAIELVAGEVLKINVPMIVGSQSETISVTATTPLLESATSSVTTTMEESAIRELPLNAYGGRDAVGLMMATVPSMTGSLCSNCTQSFIHIAGGESMSNSVFVDGIESTAAFQGSVATPGLESLQEMQVATASTDAETGAAAGGAEMFVLKSGTNKIHGSAVYFFQNEGLNANSWENNYFLAQCAAGDAACKKSYKRPDYRFNDWGVSAGGPIWKNHTFVFGDYEHYSQADWSINPTGSTVPTPQMLTGDFSQLLTQGANQGVIKNASGTPWINPCTGEPYLYGQIFDPQTQKMVNGETCATPFPGNVIPSGRLSAISQKLAAIYTKYYSPTIPNRIYNNFPSTVNAPLQTKKSFDIKVDHYFSERHHLSSGLNLQGGDSFGINGGFQYANNAGPFGSWFKGGGPYNTMARIVDNYTFTSTVLNNFSFGFVRQPWKQWPQNPANPKDYGIDSTSKYMPVISFGNASNGVGYASDSTGVDLWGSFNAYHYQDTVSVQRGRHSLRFGGTFVAQELNAGQGGEIQQYNFASDTGGPINPGLTPFVGSGFANFMLGNVYNASEAVNQLEYPRQKSFGLFAVDDFKVNPKLTLNLGLRWDVNLPGHEQAGRWENFDLTANNPNWGSYKGAWVFSKDSGTTFYTKNNLHQFGPHVGFAYQISNKLVARASYGVFYVPLGSLNSGFGAYFPANQTGLAFGVNQVQNTSEGTAAFNWDSGYPGVTVKPVQNSTTTSFGVYNYAIYIDPHILYLGHTQNWYAGLEYEFAKNMSLDVRYVGNRGGNLHDYGRSQFRDYPDWNTYKPVLASGHIYDEITDASSAANAGVAYPYPGFRGPAYAAIAPYPQAISVGATLETAGDLASNDASAFDSFVIETKARKAHGLYMDFNYVISKVTGGQYNLNNFANNWGYPAQDFDEWKQANHWLQPFDQRHLAKGYITYDLPLGRNQKWLATSAVLDRIVGGWTLGYYGSYGSGTPLGWVYSTFQPPFYFGNKRANFANGANEHNMKNFFNRRLFNPGNLGAAANKDFDTNSFAPTTPEQPSGNTPLLFNHWRWNPGAASENVSIIKHFAFGPDRRFNGSLRGDFFNVFNRHYFNAPDTNPFDSTFGQVTYTSGNRVGQLGARIEW